MKDFSGNYANVNPKLDVANSYIIYADTTSNAEVQKEYIPQNDGVVTITCSFRQASKVFLDVAESNGNRRMGSIVQSANSAGADNQVMTVPVSANKKIIVKGKNYIAEYIPYI